MDVPNDDTQGGYNPTALRVGALSTVYTYIYRTQEPTRRELAERVTAYAYRILLYVPINGRPWVRALFFPRADEAPTTAMGIRFSLLFLHIFISVPVYVENGVVTSSQGGRGRGWLCVAKGDCGFGDDRKKKGKPKQQLRHST